MSARRENGRTGAQYASGPGREVQAFSSQLSAFRKGKFRGDAAEGLSLGICFLRYDVVLRSRPYGRIISGGAPAPCRIDALVRTLASSALMNGSDERMGVYWLGDRGKDFR